MKRPVLTILIFAALSNLVVPQQVPDTLYKPVIRNPMYSSGSGPLVYIDEGHNNFHTRMERYRPFALLLERDGYRTEGYTGTFSRDRLERARILVISNALNIENVTRWYKPVLPAFTTGEISTVKDWVYEGGSLFLIADHMPMGGAAADLASAFGFRFTDGFAADTANPGPALFSRADGSLADNFITNGRNPGERVDSIYSFTGQAFTIPDDSGPILIFSDKYRLLLSDTAWVFNDKTIYRDITGWSQAAYKKYGRGKIVAGGEAAMFTAQLAGPGKSRTGMNSPSAKWNYQLLLNIVHWLDER